MTATALAPTAGPARVVVADDRPRARAALRRAARHSATVVIAGEADTATGAIAAARAARADLVLVDLRLPELGDRDVLGRLARETAAAVVVQAPRDDRPALVAALRAGARGVVHRDASERDVLGALEALARGAEPLLLRPIPRPHDLRQEDRMVTPKVIELTRGCAHGGQKRPEAAAAPAVRKG
jgi:DNA-binding NarL/FixJ family response regulator